MIAREAPLRWRLAAWLVTRRPVTAWLIRRATENPYRNIPGYMERGWVFNPYPGTGDQPYRATRFPRLPSIRVHTFLGPDPEHLHNHPWPSARTIILRGWYVEQRLGRQPWRMMLWARGHSYALAPTDFHRIGSLAQGGCTSLFITFPGESTLWGFLVDNQFVPHDAYHQSQE